MFTTAIAAQNELINSKFDLVHLELKQIKEQVVKTNGRVNKLEEKTEQLKINDIDHIVHCPNVSKIQALENKQAENAGIKKFIISSITIAGVIIAAVVEILKYYHS